MKIYHNSLQLQHGILNDDCFTENAQNLYVHL